MINKAKLTALLLSIVTAFSSISISILHPRRPYSLSIASQTLKIPLNIFSANGSTALGERLQEVLDLALKVIVHHDTFDSSHTVYVAQMPPRLSQVTSVHHSLGYRHRPRSQCWKEV